jgi:hypothetical protein
MFKMKLKYYTFLLLIVVITSSAAIIRNCKEHDYEQKLTKAVDITKTEEYYKPQQFLEDLRGIYKERQS